MDDLSRIDAETTTYTYRLLRDCADQQVATAHASKKNTYGFWLAAAVLGAMSFEAYINYLGATLDPDTWANERRVFNGPGAKKLRGPFGKLAHIYRRYSLSDPDKEAPPLSGVVELMKLRNEVAHAPLHIALDSVAFPKGAVPPITGQWLDGAIAREPVERLLADLDASMEMIHATLRHTNDGDLLLSQVRGSHMMSIGSLW